MQVPLLTWGATSFKDPQSGKETFDLALQFPRKDYSSKETDKLLANMQALENKIKAEAIQNSMAWFNKKTMTPEVIEALWTPMLKYPKDQSTGEPDVTKAPTLKVTIAARVCQSEIRENIIISDIRMETMMAYSGGLSRKPRQSSIVTIEVR